MPVLLFQSSFPLKKFYNKDLISKIIEKAVIETYLRQCRDRCRSRFHLLRNSSDQADPRQRLCFVQLGRYVSKVNFFAKIPQDG